MKENYFKRLIILCMFVVIFFASYIVVATMMGIGLFIGILFVIFKEIK